METEINYYLRVQIKVACRTELDTLCRLPNVWQPDNYKYWISQVIIQARLSSRGDMFPIYRHSAPIALIEENSTGEKLPIREESSISRAVVLEKHMATHCCRRCWTMVVAGSVSFLMKRKKEGKERKEVSFVVRICALAGWTSYIRTTCWTRSPLYPQWLRIVKKNVQVIIIIILCRYAIQQAKLCYHQ